MAVDFKTTQPIEYFRKFLEHDVRPDGRELSESRPFTLTVGSISTAEGSALVKLGNTTIMCGVKAELTTPKADEPKKGIIVTNVDLPPLCSPMFKPGPPSELAQSATIFMDDIIKSSQCLSAESLCIVEEKDCQPVGVDRFSINTRPTVDCTQLCWVLYCDLICLDYDGNLLDACSMALIAALKNTLLPSVELHEETAIPQTNMDKKTGLLVTSCPVATTFSIFDDKILFVDPTQEEEAIATGVVTIVTSKDYVHMVHKPGGSQLTEKQLQDCLHQAKKNNYEVTRIIDESILNVER